ncbi:MAG: LodA/GoxA family CTQ-dependent oxidase [Sphingomonas sp.]|jgi:hypothetical protein|uniref:LodA/GoxA family CTQ-dependent oxidase n=1 Tax=Sphingomonas sp. TaxID=28214 RepID=UPI0035638D1C
MDQKTDTDAQNALVASDIARLAIYPPLGIARVGDCADIAPSDYLLSPEVIGGLPTRPDGQPATDLTDYRGADGGLRRHAARFRIYATLHDGTVREVLAHAGTVIDWEVAVANLKAGWYEFNQAMDLPNGLAKPANRRNAAFAGNRAQLDIVPTAAHITSAATPPPAVAFAGGQFVGKPVYLGEIRVDDDGRLLVLGGFGTSNSYDGSKPTTFANNVGWHDDVADGPVRAVVTFADGTRLTADPGYIAVTPPNNAPGIVGLVTLDDAVRETFVAEGWIAQPTTTSFTNDVWPIFARLTDMQWVNQGLFMLHGHGSSLDAHDPAIVARWRDTGATAQAERQAIAHLFRTSANALAADTGELPQIFSDAEGELGDDTACLAVTPTQFAHLTRWASGQFADDWTGAPPPIADFAALDAAGQVAQLERASLHDCLGGPFHPGIELTWPMRLARVWKEPYRLAVAATNAPARQDFGVTLDPTTCIGAAGPFDGVATGALTRFLGVPWQTDGASCNSEADYKPSYFLSMPTFWGPRVPDQVLSHESYARVVANGAAGRTTQSIKHFASRSDWLRDVRGQSYFQRIALMVKEWHDLGTVLPIATDPSLGLPPTMHVETGRDAAFTRGDPKPALVAKCEAIGTPIPVVLKAAVAPAPAEGSPRRSYRQGEI